MEAPVEYDDPLFIINFWGGLPPLEAQDISAETCPSPPKKKWREEQQQQQQEEEKQEQEGDRALIVSFRDARM